MSYEDQKIIHNYKKCVPSIFEKNKRKIKLEINGNLIRLRSCTPKTNKWCWVGMTLSRVLTGQGWVTTGSVIAGLGHNWVGDSWVGSQLSWVVTGLGDNWVG